MINRLCVALFAVLMLSSTGCVVSQCGYDSYGPCSPCGAPVGCDPCQPVEPCQPIVQPCQQVEPTCGTSCNTGTFSCDTNQGNFCGNAGSSGVCLPCPPQIGIPVPSLGFGRGNDQPTYVTRGPRDFFGW